MTYSDWFESHAAKHAAILKKLAHLSDEEIIRYFRFDNMVLHEKAFCPLYETDTKCHDTEDLNCYLCGCPHFRFDDAGIDRVEEKTRFSLCSIESSDGERFITDTAIHQNCSGCLVPHKESFIRSVFQRDWRTIMNKTSIK